MTLERFSSSLEAVLHEKPEDLFDSFSAEERAVIDMLAYSFALQVAALMSEGDSQEEAMLRSFRGAIAVGWLGRERAQDAADLEAMTT